VAKGVDIEMAPLDEDHVRAKITWSEQDVGGGKLVVEVTVKNKKTLPEKPTTNLDQMRERLPYVLHEPLPIRLRISAGDLPRRRLDHSAGKLCLTRCAAPVARRTDDVCDHHPRRASNINSVPDSVTFTIDFRSIPSNSHEDFRKAIRTTLGGKAEIHGRSPTCRASAPPCAPRGRARTQWLRLQNRRWP